MAKGKAKKEVKKVDPSIKKLVDIRKIMDNGHRETVINKDSKYSILALNDAYCSFWGMTVKDRLGHGRFLAQSYLPRLEEAVAYLNSEGGFGAGSTLLNEQIDNAFGKKDGFYMRGTLVAAQKYMNEHKDLNLEEAVKRVGSEVNDAVYGPVRDYLNEIAKKRAEGLEYQI